MRRNLFFTVMCFISNSQLMQGGEIIHDENENNKIIKYSFHPSSSILLHEDNCPNHISHQISLVHTSSNL